MTAPRVTVLSSLYNDGPFVRQAIESVLAQTFTDFEYLIINDACIDESRAIAASYDDPRIRMVDNETNMGLTKTLNRGLALARGELIARFDSNDVCFPERLAKQVDYLDRHPGVGAVGVQSQIIDVTGRRIRRAQARRPISDLAIRWACVFGTPLIHSGAMYRRAIVFDELGGYNESFRVGQDAELWFRMLEAWRLANIDERLMAVRYDSRSISGDVAAPVRQGYLERWTPTAAARMRELLKMEVPEEWARMNLEIFQPAVELSPAEFREAARVIDRCHARFVELFVDAADDTEVRRQVAEIYRQIVMRMAKVDRVASLTLFGRMLALHRRTAFEAVLRYAALALFGGSAVRLWRRWRSLRSH